MQIWQFILFTILWIPIEYLCIMFEVKCNKELFYDLHKKDIERCLKKYDKKWNEKKKLDNGFVWR